MAKKAKANGDGSKNGRGRLSVNKKEAKSFFSRLDRLHDELESKSGEYRVDIKEVFSEASDKLGVSRKIFRHEYSIHRAKLKIAAKEKELEPEEREDLDALRLALGSLADTPLGKAAVTRERDNAEAVETADA